MKLNKTIVKEDLSPLADKCQDLFGETYSMLIALLNVEKVMVPKEVYLSKYELDEDEEFEYFQLDTLETLCDLNVGKTMSIFVKAVGSKNPSTHRRLRMLAQEFGRLRDLAQESTDKYLPLSKREIDNISDYIIECLGQVSYFLYYQFNVDKFMKGYDNDEDELEVDVSMFNYCDSKGYDIAKVAVLINKTMLEHKPTLPVFDEVPELEDQFYDIVGGYVMDFDKLESKLTVDDVKFVIESPDMNFEEFIASIQARP